MRGFGRVAVLVSFAASWGAACSNYQGATADGGAGRKAASSGSAGLGGATSGGGADAAAGAALSAGTGPATGGVASGEAGMDAGGSVVGGNAGAGGAASGPPNVLFILIDDMGWADLTSYGNTDIQTTNIDQLAKDGTRFTQYYVSSPVCSPSRASFMTGQVPGRYNINGHFDTHAADVARNMPDFLPLSAPSVARQFKAAGYHTAHFGKWHLGGGRDVGNAPWPTAYGFDESFTSFEGLGDRVLVTGDALSEASAKLGQGNIVWAEQKDESRIYVDHAVDFLTRYRAAPFYLQVWLNEVHDPFDPKPELMQKYAAFSKDPYIQQYYATIDSMDQQIGRLLGTLDTLGLRDNTVVVLSSDNGPTAWPRYYNAGATPPGKTGGLRGRKWSLYEGGDREPLIVRWPGKIPAGKVNEHAVMSGIDYLPTLMGLIHGTLPASKPDGEDFSDVWLGADRVRATPLYWEYGHFATQFPGLAIDKSPPLAMRSGDWKLLMKWDGTAPELYDLQTDVAETTNVATKHPVIANNLKQLLGAWRDQIWP